MSEASLAAAFRSRMVASLPGIVTYSGLKESSRSMPSVLFGKITNVAHGGADIIFAAEETAKRLGLGG